METSASVNYKGIELFVKGTINNGDSSVGVGPYFEATEILYEGTNIIDLLNAIDGGIVYDIENDVYDTIDINEMKNSNYEKS